MSTNCWPGCRAIIIKGPTELIGRLVEVQEADERGNEAPVGSTYRAAGGIWAKDQKQFCWIIETMGAPFVNARGRKVQRRPYPDDYLFPLIDEWEIDDMFADEEPVKRQLRGTAMLNKLLGEAK